MNLGLLGGIAEGLKSGMTAYNTERDYQDKKSQEAIEKAMRDRAYQLQLAQAGYNDVGGSLVRTPEAELQAKVASSKANADLQGYDPTSDRSKTARTMTAGILKSAKIDSSGLIPDNATEKDLENKLLEKAVTGSYGVQGRVLTSDRIAESNAIKRDNTNIRKDQQASHAADTVHKDPRVIQLTRQMEQLERGRGILDQPTITNQEFNDYQQEIQAAISGAGGGALGKLERTEYNSVQQSLAALKQKITGTPQDAVPKEIVERLKVLADHTRDVMDKHRSDRASSLQRNFRSNDAANEEMGKAIDTYKASDRQPGLLSPNPAPSGLLKTPTLEQAPAGLSVEQFKAWKRQNGL